MIKRKFAFTLAEVLIVLAVIGVLTAVLLPAARHSVPNENVMKFKKGHADLMKTIAELVNSDKYYSDGNLAIRVNGSYITGNNEGDVTYFCECFADVLTTKSVNCNTDKVTWATIGGLINKTLTASDWREASILEYPDEGCKDRASAMGAEIITSGDITYYQTAAIPFGVDDYTGVNKYLFLETVGQYNAPGTSIKARGVDESYRVSKNFCMDIDGINKGEDPFGYSIRADGKVIVGARAQEWLKKGIQEKE